MLLVYVVSGTFLEYITYATGIPPNTTLAKHTEVNNPNTEPYYSMIVLSYQGITA